MIPRIDTHQHLWDPSRFSYSWMHGLPALNVPQRMEEYRQASQGTGIIGSVYVETDVDVADLASDTAWIFDLASDPSNRILGIVAGARLETQDCFRHLLPFQDNPKLKGVRRVLHTQDDAIFSNPVFLKNLAAIEPYGWSFDLCVLPRQLRAALGLVKQFPGITFILDHCGSPDVRQRSFEPWRSDIEALAAQPNIFCKLSGFVVNADPASTFAGQLRPFAKDVIRTFGWDRVLWGSDWPVCTLACSFKEWASIAAEILSDMPHQQQAAIFRDNACRAYRLSLSDTTAGGAT